MKKILFLTALFSGIFFLSYSQETNDDTVFDYSLTKHELSLDIAPIFNGSYPSNLLYRQNYLKKNGKPVAFRLGALISGNFGSAQNEGFTQNNVDRNNQNIQVYVGKEWQKQFQRRILGYYGADFSLGYGRNYFEVIPTHSNQNNFVTKSSGFTVGAIGFAGMKYHFSKHFSVSAETSLNLSFFSTVNEVLSNYSEPDKSTSNNFGFGMSPLRALRFAFHF